MPSQLITVTEDGTIAGYNPNVDPNNAIIVVDNSVAGTAVYKGVALLNDSLFVANFRSGFVEVYNSTWTLTNTFTDPALTAIGYAPFNVAAINGSLYVSFAKQDVDLHDDVAGVGNGFIDVFDTSGTLIKNLVARGQLNSPWAIVSIKDGSQIAVGNFGNGQINIYWDTDGTFAGRAVICPTDTPLVIDSLWGLATITKSHNSIPSLFFTAGINSENNGLAGTLTPC